VIIPGYLNGYEPPFLRSPLVDGPEMMSSSPFWAAFLYAVGGPELAPSAFGSDPADLSQFIDRFLDPRRWPVFSQPLQVTITFTSSRVTSRVTAASTTFLNLALAASRGHSQPWKDTFADPRSRGRRIGFGVDPRGTTVTAQMRGESDPHQRIIGERDRRGSRLNGHASTVTPTLAQAQCHVA
jgi:hypothetical protein